MWPKWKMLSKHLHTVITVERVMSRKLAQLSLQFLLLHKGFTVRLLLCHLLEEAGIATLSFKTGFVAKITSLAV